MKMDYLHYISSQKTEDSHKLVALVHEWWSHLAYIPWQMAIFVDDNIYNVHRKERAEGKPVVEITRTFLCSICFVVSCQHKCTSQSSLTETIKSLSSVSDAQLSYRQNCHVLDHCTCCVWMGKTCICTLILIYYPHTMQIIILSLPGMMVL